MKKISIKSIAITATLMLCFCNVNAQVVVNSPYKKGFQFLAADSSFFTKMNVRIQQRYDGMLAEGSDQYTDLMRVRRARLKFDGWGVNPTLGYKMEFDLVNGNVLDAILKWKPNKHFEFWFGQTKLPGNIERVISSQQLQFVDRSLLNSQYNIDRDKGVWFRYYFDLGNMPVRAIAAITQGEGRNFTSTSTGHDYTGRVEFLPFGNFGMKKSDYFAADLGREEKPKLIMGVTFDYNEGAIREQGQRGDVLSESRNITSLFADMHFKYNGWSVMCEYANRETEKTPAIFDATNNMVGTFNVGNALNCQAGYLFKNNWELAGRYTTIDHVAETALPNITEYTFAVSHYIADHKFKTQADISLNQTAGRADRYILRLQVEIGL